MTRPGYLEKVPNVLCFCFLDCLSNFVRGTIWNVQPQLYNVTVVKLIVDSQMVPCLENLHCCCGGFQFSSVAQSCLTLCSPMDCKSQASLSITNSWSLLQFMSIHVHHVQPWWF